MIPASKELPVTASTNGDFTRTYTQARCPWGLSSHRTSTMQSVVTLNLSPKWPFSHKQSWSCYPQNQEAWMESVYSDFWARSWSCSPQNRVTWMQSKVILALIGVGVELHRTEWRECSLKWLFSLELEMRSAETRGMHVVRSDFKPIQSEVTFSPKRSWRYALQNREAQICSP